jgi:hypothetical protein
VRNKIADLGLPYFVSTHLLVSVNPFVLN